MSLGSRFIKLIGNLSKGQHLPKNAEHSETNQDPSDIIDVIYYSYVLQKDNKVHRHAVQCPPYHLFLPDDPISDNFVSIFVQYQLKCKSKSQILEFTLSGELNFFTKYPVAPRQRFMRNEFERFSNTENIPSTHRLINSTSLFSAIFPFCTSRIDSIASSLREFASSDLALLSSGSSSLPFLLLSFLLSLLCFPFLLLSPSPLLPFLFFVDSCWPWVEWPFPPFPSSFASIFPISFVPRSSFSSSTVIYPSLASFYWRSPPLFPSLPFPSPLLSPFACFLSHILLPCNAFISSPGIQRMRLIIFHSPLFLRLI